MAEEDQEEFDDLLQAYSDSDDELECKPAPPKEDVADASAAGDAAAAAEPGAESAAPAP